MRQQQDAKVPDWQKTENITGSRGAQIRSQEAGLRNRTKKGNKMSKQRIENAAMVDVEKTRKRPLPEKSIPAAEAGHLQNLAVQILFSATVASKRPQSCASYYWLVREGREESLGASFPHAYITRVLRGQSAPLRWFPH